MGNVIMANDSAEWINMLQANLAKTDSALTALKIQQSIHDIAKLSVETKDEMGILEHIIIILFSLLMLLFLSFLARKFTFGNWTKSNPNPYQEETLGMPKGTMRGVITFTLLFFAVLIELHVIRNPLVEIWSDKFITSFQMVLAFYFGSQVVSGLSSKDVEKTKNMTDAATGANTSAASVTPTGDKDGDTVGSGTAEITDVPK